MAKITGNSKTKMSRILGTVPELGKLQCSINCGGKKERVGPVVKLYIVLKFIVRLAIGVTNKESAVYKGGRMTIR